MPLDCEVQTRGGAIMTHTNECYIMWKNTASWWRSKPSVCLLHHDEDRGIRNVSICMMMQTFRMPADCEVQIREGAIMTHINECYIMWKNTASWWRSKPSVCLLHHDEDRGTWNVSICMMMQTFRMPVDCEVQIREGAIMTHIKSAMYTTVWVMYVSNMYRHMECIWVMYRGTWNIVYE